MCTRRRRQAVARAALRHACAIEGGADALVEHARAWLDDEDRASIARVQSASSGPGGDVYDLERVKGGPHASIMRYTLGVVDSQRDRT